MKAMLICFFAMIVAGCHSTKPLQTVSQVDLDRFSGKWFVVASIGTFIERDAHNAVETYTPAPDGKIVTEFRFREGAFDGPVKTYRPTGYVRDSSNAVWGMQFLWPFKADYRIIYLDEDYKTTVIGRNARDYVWIMAREPRLSDQEYESLVQRIAQVGYDVSALARVPHCWPETRAAADCLAQWHKIRGK